MLKQLGELSHPITDNLVVLDDGCQFNILTSVEGFSCMAGGAFPINGPFKLPLTLHENLIHVLSIQGTDSLEETIEEHIPDESRRKILLEVLDVIGEEATKEFFRSNWPATRPFYVFHDMGREDSDIFSSLEAAYEHFIENFAIKGSGSSWKSMSDDELIKWVEMVENWRTDGAKKLPSREWLGAYYSAWDGTAEQRVFQHE